MPTHKKDKQRHGQDKSQSSQGSMDKGSSSSQNLSSHRRDSKSSQGSSSKGSKDHVGMNSDYDDSRKSSRSSSSDSDSSS